MEKLKNSEPEFRYYLLQPVSFKINVNGNILTADLLSAIFQEWQGYELHIRFSDGHEDAYTFDEGKAWNSCDQADMYCKALADEIISILVEWNLMKQLYCIQVDLSGEEVNAWIVECENEKNEQYFSIFFKNDYRFDVKKVGGQWWSGSHRKIEADQVNQDIAGKVTSALNYYLHS